MAERLTMKLCTICGEPCNDGRCDQHRPEKPNKTSRHERGGGQAIGAREQVLGHRRQARREWLSMSTITRHAPVVPTKAVSAELDNITARGILDLRRANPPRWLDEWIDLNLYRNSSTAERRQIALDGLERQAQAHAAADAAKAAQALPEVHEYRPSKARPARILSTRHVRPGTPYVPCAAGCDYMHLSSRPALIYCPDCKPAQRRKRAKATDTDPTTNYLI